MQPEDRHERGGARACCVSRPTPETAAAELRRVLERNLVATEAPTNMRGLCETIGATYYFRITGVTEGQLWGTDIYSGDSTLGAAAVHAGLLKPGQADFLKVTVVPPPDRSPALRGMA